MLLPGYSYALYGFVWYLEVYIMGVPNRAKWLLSNIGKEYTYSSQQQLLTGKVSQTDLS